MSSLAIVLAGCANPNGTTNNTGTDSAIGTGAGALFGGVLGNVLGHNAASTLAGAALGGIAGYVAGSYIGQQLDARDRELAAQQTSDVLTERVALPPPGHVLYIAPRHRRAHHWSSDHTTTSGSSTLEQVSTTPDGNQCRLVRELAVINGREVVQHTSYCQTAEGNWKAQAA
jgi:hypothetical protein